MLKSNCDTPIDVWLVSGHHQHQQKEEDEAAFSNANGAMSSAQVKHEQGLIAGSWQCGQTQSNITRHYVVLCNQVAAFVTCRYRTWQMFLG